MNDHCLACKQEHCVLREASHVPPSAGFRRAFPVHDGLWLEFKAQRPAQHVLNAVAAVLLVVCVIAFGWLVL